MNGIEKFSKKIEKTGHRLMQPKETLLDGIIQQFMTQIGSAIKTAADCWKTNRKRALVEMADNGWYPNWFTFFYAPRKAPCSINELMEITFRRKLERYYSKNIRTMSKSRTYIKNSISTSY
ncbi:MAG: hypothetical protein JRJ49_07220 [Deltaproteobacteria bacterium]|nr:hypothetical protein [Deltaproteobacteria bacterium]